MSKAISRRDFMRSPALWALPAFWLPAAATCCIQLCCSPPLLPLPLLLQTRAWHCTDGPVSMTISWWGGDSRSRGLPERHPRSSRLSTPTSPSSPPSPHVRLGSEDGSCLHCWQRTGCVPGELNWLYNYSADGSKFVDLNTVSNFLDLTQWDIGCHGCLLRCKLPAVRARFHDRPYLLLEHDHLQQGRHHRSPQVSG